MEEQDIPPHAQPSSEGRVKNKAPAKIQITAEQLLREAWDRKESATTRIPKQHIADLEELQEYQRTERKQYEQRIVRNRQHTPLWQRYARWEESQQDFPRARSVWERAIDNDYRNPAIWLGYAEMEMRHRFVNHARNVFDRAVALLPRVDQLWLKYAHMEEMLEQIPLARLVYSRWLKWLPQPSAFFAAIRFELRHGYSVFARGLYQTLVRDHPTSHSYVKFAKFEERHDDFANARAVYERATEELPEHHLTAPFFLSFAKFEERRKQPIRARAIYNFALSKLTNTDVDDLHRAFTSFEKQQGDRQILDNLLVKKKRLAFNETLAENPFDYDTWYDLLQLEEANSPDDQVRITYERALNNAPPSATKPAWQRYIYIWISYAVWAELSVKSTPSAVEIYSRCISAIPHRHRKFSFGQVWVLYAEAHVRNGNISGARRALGVAIGVLPGEEDVYRAYLALETGLGEVHRARAVLHSWLEKQPRRGDVWLELAALEDELGEAKRAASVLRLAVGVDDVSQMHAVWERLVSAESEAGAGDAAVRDVFEGYVERCDDARAWIGYARFCMRQGEEGCRAVFGRAARALKGRVVEGGTGRELHADGLREVVGAWVEWEEQVEEGDESEERAERIEKVRALRPERVQRRREINGAWEEVWETVLPEERVDVKARNNKLFEAAKLWKIAQTRGASA